MNFVFHPEAELEFMDAIAYYENSSIGLGIDFSLSIHAGIVSICAFPEAWPFFHGGIKRYLVNRFPYGILYQFKNETVQIIAVMHLHREPGYWKERSF